MKIERIGYHDPRNHNFIRTGWKIKFFRWEWLV